MAEYKLADVQIDKEPFKDQNGNTWITVAFEGISEPVKWVVKDPSKLVVGNTYNGEIKDATSKAGKPYRRFYREQADNRSSYRGSDYNPDGQRQGMAIKCAADFVTKWADKKLSPQEFAVAVKPYALVLFNMELKDEQASGTTNPGDSHTFSTDPETESLMNSLPSFDDDNWTN